MLGTAVKLGAAVAVVPAAIVGLGSARAEATIDCINGQVVDLDYHCYVSCVGICSDEYSACNSDPYQSSNTIACRNGFYTGTPARAVAKCYTNHPHSMGYGCCVYC